MLAKGNEAQNARVAARSSIAGVSLTLIALASLHVVSPEFAPSWRVLSEYALGRFGWLLSLMFITWALATWALSFSLWSQVTTRAGKTGVALFAISGVGGAMASVFDIRHPLHGAAGMLGMLGTIAVVVLSVSLSRLPTWTPVRRLLLWLGHANWIAIVLLFASLAALMITYKQAGGDMTSPPKELPPGVIGLVGYANRFGVLANLAWMLVAAWWIARLERTDR